MPTIDNAAVEVEAGALLRERIEDDVERYWAMVVQDAVQNLLDRV
jgi:hypothetical protein